jgi:hypothetical protein
MQMSPTEFENTLREFAEVTGSAVGDQPTATDSLGFAPYVESLAAFLRSDATTPPLTVSIEGEWGSGKSSFMMQLEQAIAGSSRWQRFLVKLPAWLGGDGEELSPWPATVALFKTRQLCTIQFNAWRHDKQDAVWAAFALAMSKRLRARVGFFHAWIGDFRLCWFRLSVPSIVVKLLFLIALTTLIVLISHDVWPHNEVFNRLLNESASLVEELKLLKPFPAVYAWLKTRGNLGTVALAVLGVIGALYKIQRPMERQLNKYVAKPGYADHAAFVETFHKDFARVIRAYAGHQRVFVFIDDLDRCDVPKAAELMQAINLMIGESGNLVFVLGMDREKVAAGISLKYKDLIAFLPEYQSSIAAAPSTPGIPVLVHVTPAATDNERQADTKADERVAAPVAPIAPAGIAANYLRFGSSYLEKFIQLSFAIPVISKKQDFDRFLNGLTPQPARARWLRRVLGYWRQAYKKILSKNSSNQQINTTSSHGIDISPPSPARASEAREERVQQIQIKIGEDGAGVRVVVEMVGPIFGNNPRRLKQFISTFRLALSIYGGQGIFDLRDDKPVATPQQIAKILALLLRFPDLRSDLVETPDLFARLESDALASSTSSLLSHPGVRKVLLHGVSLSSNGDTPTQHANPFSLQLVDVSFLLSVLPKRIYTETPPGPANARVEVSSSGERRQAQTSESANGTVAQTSERAPVGSPSKTEPYSESGVREFLAQAGRDYENIRRTQKAGPTRTAAMTESVHSIQRRVADVPPQITQQLLTEQIKEDTAGSRIVALAIAAEQISAGNIPFLLDMFGRFRTPFEHYWCIRALMAHSGFFTPEQASEIVESYKKNQGVIQSDPGRAALAAQLLDLAKSHAVSAESSSSSAM